jgi:hypothetical protein
MHVSENKATSHRHPANFKRERITAIQTAEEISELSPQEEKWAEELELAQEFAGFYGAKSLGGWM